MASNKTGLVITGKCVSKKNKSMYAFIGKPEERIPGGFHFHKHEIVEVFDKNNYKAMKKGMKVVVD